MAKFIRSAAEFATAIQVGVTTESIFLEFKAEADGRLIQKGEPEREKKRRAGAKELARDIAQFANTDGGCLLIGLAEGKRNDGVKVVEALLPVVDEEGLREWIEHAIAEFIVPPTLSVDLQAIEIDGSKVLAVNVPASRALVSLWDRQSHSIEYLRRTSRGKAWLNPDEVERHMMNGSRAAYLTLSGMLERSQSKEVTLTDSIWVEFPGAREQRSKPSGTVRIATVDTESFSLIVPVGARLQTVQIPHGVVEHVWMGNDGKINLIMSVRLFTTTDGGDLELKALR